MTARTTLVPSDLFLEVSSAGPQFAEFCASLRVDFFAASVGLYDPDAKGVNSGIHKFVQGAINSLMGQ
jgi:hypothetical protein